MSKTRAPGSLEELMERVTHFRVPSGPPTAGQSKLAGSVLVLVLLLVTAMTGFYQVDAEEAGVVTRMGKHVRTVDPGLRMKAPWGIERIHRVPVQRQLKLEFGFRTDERRTGQERFTPVQAESLMLTGDLNAVNVEFSIQLRASDPYAYLFNVRDRDIALRALAEATMREVVGDRTVTEVLTVGRQEIEVTTRNQLNELVTLYQMGITIDQVVLQDVTPPGPVRASWDEVNQAQQQRDRVINEAWAEYNRVIPRALGQAEEQILLARAYEVERLNRARGEAARFESVYEEYRKAPRVTRARIYNEALQGILSGVNEMYIFDEGTASPHSVLPLNFPAPRAETTTTAAGGN
jgi:modulator of FtsH protease HflK